MSPVARPRILRTVLATVLLVAAVGPVPAADEEALAARLGRLERQLEAKGLVDLLQQIEALQQEVRRLQGELENQAYTLEQLRKTQVDTYADLDQRLAALAGGAAVAAAGVAGPAAAPVLVEPPLPTTAAPAAGSVAGTPAEQSMALDIETSAVGPRLGPPPAASALNDVDAARQAAAAAPGVMLVPPGQAALATPTQQPAAVAAPAPGTLSITPAAAPAPAQPLAAAPPVPPAASGARGPTVDSPESEAAYRDAFTLLKAGQYEQAVGAFEAYLAAYPASQYNDNAQYWLGEAHYVMRQFEPAIVHYQKVVTDYPDSQKQSHAMLKIAYSYDELGRRDAAAAVLEDLKQRFAGSAAARLADERLARLRAAAP